MAKRKHPKKFNHNLDRFKLKPDPVMRRAKFNDVNGVEKPTTPAEIVIAKFGGARNLMRALKQVDPEMALNPSSIYRWTYPKSKGGTGGVIPTRTLPKLMKAARLVGIFITSEDLYPNKVLPDRVID